MKAAQVKEFHNSVKRIRERIKDGENPVSLIVLADFGSEEPQILSIHGNSTSAINALLTAQVQVLQSVDKEAKK